MHLNCTRNHIHNRQCSKYIVYVENYRMPLIFLRRIVLTFPKSHNEPVQNKCLPFWLLDTRKWLATLNVRHYQLTLFEKLSHSIISIFKGGPFPVIVIFRKEALKDTSITIPTLTFSPFHILNCEIYNFNRNERKITKRGELNIQLDLYNWIIIYLVIKCTKISFFFRLTSSFKIYL